MRIDSHVHIVGPPDRYPQVPERKYLADGAAIHILRRLGSERGISRFVVVQPSFYGADNTATLDALDALGDAGRGVAVIDPADIGDETLSDFDRRGVRGLRINLYSQLSGPPASLEERFSPIAKIAGMMNWHVQVIAPLATLLAAADVLAKSPVAAIVDHYGIYGSARPDSAEGRRLLELLRMPHIWIKLSAPYRVSDNPLQTKPDKEWLAAIIAVARNRCVWGSDWPFTPQHDRQTGAALIAPYRTIGYRALVDDFLAALPSPDLVDPIMIENPARFYEFD